MVVATVASVIRELQISRARSRRASRERERAAEHRGCAGGRRGDNEGETGAVFTLNGALFVARKWPRKILGRESGVGSWDGWRAGGAVSFELVVRDGAGLTSWRGTLARAGVENGLLLASSFIACY